MFQKILLLVVLVSAFLPNVTLGIDVDPLDIEFTRQAVLRPIFDPAFDIPLSALVPEQVVGLEVMYPSMSLDGGKKARYTVDGNKLVIAADKASKSALWVGGANPFAAYDLELSGLKGDGSVGFGFMSLDGKERLCVMLDFEDGKIVSSRSIVYRDGKETYNRVMSDLRNKNYALPLHYRLQMLGSGFSSFIQQDGLPEFAGQLDFNKMIDLRLKKAIHKYHFRLVTDLNDGAEVKVRKAASAISAGVGLADLRAITYQDGRPYLEDGRVWYTISIRGRALPHHIQGVFSMDPSVFDFKLEGIILFDRGDGLLRNEIASHIFYDENRKVWRGVTTGFTACADLENEEKEIWAVESDKDPRFGFSIMKAHHMSLVGNYEDAHVIYDDSAKKWRMLLCENHGGYKAVVRESNIWDRDYKLIGGPVKVDSTGTQIQKIGSKRYCLFGSSDRKMYVYTYPDLRPHGELDFDLLPWSKTSGTRVWTNVVPLPKGYPARYVSLSMDRFNYPGLQGANWSYGALYLYHGQHPDTDEQPYEYDMK